MGLFKKLFAGSESEKTNDMIKYDTVAGAVYAPLTGTAITLKEIGDGVFSEGLLGDGCGIKPDDNVIYAPFNGTIIQIPDSKHAIGIESDDGIELLIHVGLDTVAMKGKGFHVLISSGDKVKCGQKLMTFDRDAISKAGYPDTTAVLVTNTDDFDSVEFFTAGSVSATDNLLKCTK